MEQTNKMGQASRWCWIHCLSPLHVGSGDGVGVIDMPIQREKVTEWPMIPGSSLKGVQREFYRLRGKDESWINPRFGVPGDQDGTAGALVTTDGRILAFPVASRYGTFAYVTCPLVLKRLHRDAHVAGLDMSFPDLDEFDNSSESGEAAWISNQSAVYRENVDEKEIFLDEFAGKAIESDSFSEWATAIGEQLFGDEASRMLWLERVVLVTDETFQYFTSMCCEVTPRIRISEDTKTVVNGALWYEEYVPAEAVFYGLIWCDRVGGSSELTGRRALLEELEQEMVLQIGGNTSVGKGRVRCRLSGGKRQ